MADNKAQPTYTPYSPPAEAHEQQQYQSQQPQQQHIMTPTANATTPQPQAELPAQAPTQAQDAHGSDAPPQYYNQQHKGQQQQQQQQQQQPQQHAQTNQPQQPYVPSVPLHMINDANQYIDCPFCHAHTQTAITTSGSDKQIIVGALLCLICVCCAIIPCVAGWFEVTEYRCRACKQLVASRPSDAPVQVYGPSAPVMVAPGQHPAMQLNQVQNKTAYQQQMGMPQQPAPTAQPSQSHPTPRYDQPAGTSPAANYGQPTHGSPAPDNGQAHGVAPANNMQYGVSSNEKSAAGPPQ